MRRLARVLAALVSCAALVSVLACERAEHAPSTPSRESGGPLVVYAVNEPLRYFAARIGGAQVESFMPAPADVDPAFWLPEVEDVLAYQAADLILRSGADYARWIAYASLPERSQVDASGSFHDRLIVETGGVTHSHGPNEANGHGATAITIWLDFELAAQQAEAIYEAIAAALPDQRAALEERWTVLERDLLALDARLARVGAALDGETLLFSHPVYQYLQRRYGLDGHSLHWEPDRDPGPAEWATLGARQQRAPVRLMLWEAEPLPETRRRLGELGIATVVFDPGANAGPGTDWIERMQANAERLERAAASGSSAVPATSSAAETDPRSH